MRRGGRAARITAESNLKPNFASSCFWRCCGQCGGIVCDYFRVNGTALGFSAIWSRCRYPDSDPTLELLAGESGSAPPTMTRESVRVRLGTRPSAGRRLEGRFRLDSYVALRRSAGTGRATVNDLCSQAAPWCGSIFLERSKPPVPHIGQRTVLCPRVHCPADQVSSSDRVTPACTHPRHKHRTMTEDVVPSARAAATPLHAAPPARPRRGSGRRGSGGCSVASRWRRPVLVVAASG